LVATSLGVAVTSRWLYFHDTKNETTEITEPTHRCAERINDFDPLVTPGVKISLNRVEMRKILWQHPPLATGLGDIEDGIDDVTQADGALAPADRWRWHVRSITAHFGSMVSLA
jgi:hypothetical protein